MGTLGLKITVLVVKLFRLYYSLPPVVFVCKASFCKLDSFVSLIFSLQVYTLLSFLIKTCRKQLQEELKTDETEQQKSNSLFEEYHSLVTETVSIMWN